MNFLSWNVRLQGQTGDVVGGQCSLTSGTVLDGIYRCPVTLPQFSAVGTWQVVSVTARDAVNNPRIYSSTDLTSLGFPSTFINTGQQDLAAPVLASFVIDTPTVDTSSGPATVLATAVVQDDLSGVNFLSWNVRLQGQTGDVVGGQCSLTSGTVLDGIYRCPVTLPQFSAVGTWQVVSVTARDAVNNPRIYSSTDLTSLGFPSTFINTGQQDLAAPVLASFVIDTPTVDTSSGPATVLATAVVQDDLSGVNFLSWNVRLQGQTGDVVGGQCSLTVERCWTGYIGVQ